MKESAKTCWDFFKCPANLKKKCPAARTGSGKDCWTVAETFREKGCAKDKYGFRNCSECSWFKKSNPKLL